MRILFLTETIPFPLDSGGRVKTYHTLQSLADEHEIHCHAFIRSAAERRHAGELERHCASLTLHLRPPGPAREAGALALSLATRTPFTVARHYFRGVLRRLVRSCAERRFDAAYYDHLSMLAYARRLGLPAIHDAHNVEYDLVRRHAATLPWSPVRLFVEREWRLLRRYERARYARCGLIFAVSERDAAAIRSLAGGAPEVRVVPISIDARAMAAAGPRPRRPDLLFVGGLHWPPNADAVAHFARDIWPLVRREAPDATLTVVGRADAPVAQALRRIDGIRLAGHVPDVAPYFERARAFVVPLRAGGGMRVKILEALARGLPVVSTAIGVEGIDAAHGVHLLVADDPGSFARAVSQVVGNDGLAAELAAAGRRLVLERYDRSVVGEKLRRDLRECGGQLGRPTDAEQGRQKSAIRASFD
ncbi:MAG TPA: glycosyltransferase [Vicinamibacterales bacterium]|nr:glycosyltransferase [Vicinamibacterales bacterium]HPK70401.1 glycosyltransferase [Vicinamibacterales bacterium]